MTMRVSIVVPVRNGEDFLAQTLHSIASQTLPATETIVVDNGSTDASVAIAQRFAPAVRVLRAPAEGASAARIVGVQAATGDAIMFLDADDLLGPTVLEELVAVLREAPDAVAACGWMRYECADGVWSAAPPSCAPRRLGDDDLSGWLRGWYHPPCSLLWSRAAYAASGGWDPDVRVNTDGDVMMRALVAGTRLIRTAGGMSYYRRLPGEAVSLSGKRRTRTGLTSRLFVIDRIAQRLAEAGRLNAYRHALADAYDILAEDAGAQNEDLAARAREAARRLAGDGARRALRRRLRARLPVVADHRLAARPSVVARREPAADRPAPISASPPTDWPLVSVVLPVLEREGAVARTLESILAQTHTRLEVILVADAARQDALAAFAASDPRIRRVTQAEGHGAAAARNRGMEEAAGALIAFADAGDAWAPEKLERQVALMRRRPVSVGLCHTGSRREGAAADGVGDEAPSRGDLWAELLCRNPISGTGGVMIRREVVAAVGGFDPTLGSMADHEYWTRIARFFEIDQVPDRSTIRHVDADARELEARDFEAVSAARREFDRRFAAEGKRAGVRHLFLLDSARRELGSDVGSARRAALHLARAIRSRPTQPRLWFWLALCVLPKGRRGAVLGRFTRVGSDR